MTNPDLAADARLDAERKLTMVWIAYGCISYIIVLGAAWAFMPRPAPIAAPIDRLLLALQLAAAPGFVMLLILQGLWRIFDNRGAEDPFAGKESQRWKINQRVLSNTLEQALIFMPIYLGLAVRMAPDQVYWLPLLMGLWCVARLMFWVGYQTAPHLRAPGMDWTTSTAAVTALLFAVTLF